MVWSNIFKQGVTKGNPAGDVAEKQREVAIEELRKEVQTLKPDLIVLVTVDYYEEIAKAAFKIFDGSSMGDDGRLHVEIIEVQKYSIWWRKAYDGVPAIVWMNHPQGKLRGYKDQALKVMKDVMNWHQ